MRRVVGVGNVNQPPLLIEKRRARAKQLQLPPLMREKPFRRQIRLKVQRARKFKKFLV